MDDNGDEVTIRPGINGSSAQIELETRLLKMLEKPQPHLVPVQERNCPLALKCSTIMIISKIVSQNLKRLFCAEVNKPC